MRGLSQDLGINPLTVARAYTGLERQGYVTGRMGRGTFVSDAPPKMADGDRRRELRRRLRLFLHENEAWIESPDEIASLVRVEAKDVLRSAGRA